MFTYFSIKKKNVTLPCLKKKNIHDKGELYDQRFTTSSLSNARIRQPLNVPLIHRKLLRVLICNSMK